MDIDDILKAAKGKLQPAKPGGGTKNQPPAPGPQDNDSPLPVETGSEEELSELLKGFKSRADREDTRMIDATDSEYWICICFQTREQKEEFLDLLHLLDIGDKYLDGMQVAKRLGLSLKSRIPDMPRLRIDTELESLTHPRK